MRRFRWLGCRNGCEGPLNSPDSGCGEGCGGRLANLTLDSSSTGTARATVTSGGSCTPETITFTAPTSPISYTTGPANLSGSSLTITGLGSIVLSATQTGNANYAAAPTVPQTIVVSYATPRIRRL